MSDSSTVIVFGRAESRWVDLPVEQEVDRYGAQVPHGVRVEDPEHGGEVEQLQQGQAVEQHHHQATLPPVGQSAPVLPAPAQPPQQVHHAWKDKETLWRWDVRLKAGHTFTDIYKLFYEKCVWTVSVPMVALAAML